MLSRNSRLLIIESGTCSFESHPLRHFNFALISGRCFLGPSGRVANPVPNLVAGAALAAVLESTPNQRRIFRYSSPTGWSRQRIRLPTKAGDVALAENG